MSRRLRALIALSFLVASLSIAMAAPAKQAAAAANPIVVENQQTAGVSSGWMLSKFARDDLTQQIKGYASATSVLQGGSLNLYVTVNPAQTFTIDFYRVGWYGGAGGRLMGSSGPLNGAPQAACPVVDAGTSLVACNWSVSYAINPVPSTWTSGVYLGVLTNAAGWQNYVTFVVRDDRPAAFLYQQSVTTYEAYNNYPNNGTGKSLYDFNSAGGRAYKVSFDRPYSYVADGSGQFLAFGEVDMVRWLEKNGYDVTYSTDVDTHANGAALLNHKAFMSVAHDEYWSKQMFDAAAAARDAGVNLGFFGADAAYWQIRFESSSAGVANRVIVCYKDATLDPVQGPTTTVNFRSAPVNRPEQTLEGVQFTSMVNFGSNADYVVTNAGSWAYAGTGLQEGATVPKIVGYEMDRFMTEYPGPTVISQTLLSRSPFINASGVADYANSSIYQAPSGAWVFGAGTISWSQALDNEDSVVYWSSFNAVSPAIQAMTANILNAFLVGAPVVHHLQVTAPSSATAGSPFAVTVTAVNFQGNPVTQYAGTVHLTSSDGQAVLPADYTFTAGDAGTHQFSVTLKTAGSQTVTETDVANGSITASQKVGVAPAPASSLRLSGIGNATAGTAQTATVTLFDPYGNLATGFTGTAHFSSSDAQAALPMDYTYTASDAGSHQFNVTLKTAGSQTVTAASGTMTSTVTATIHAASASQLMLNAPANATTAMAFPVSVTLKDAYGNVADGYRGTVGFTSSDPLAQLPSSYTFTAGDAGTHTFQATLVTPTVLSPTTITASDSANPALQATSSTTVV
jgi:hypothetical protein